jgi:hypothetical protein
MIIPGVVYLFSMCLLYLFIFCDSKRPGFLNLSAGSQYFEKSHPFGYRIKHHGGSSWASLEDTGKLERCLKASTLETNANSRFSSLFMKTKQSEIGSKIYPANKKGLNNVKVDFEISLFSGYVTYPPCRDMWEYAVSSCSKATGRLTLITRVILLISITS